MNYSSATCGICSNAKAGNYTNAGEAFTDPVFDDTPNIAPAGENIIWA